MESRLSCDEGFGSAKLEWRFVEDLFTECAIELVAKDEVDVILCVPGCLDIKTEITISKMKRQREGRIEG
jgi:hypothetical protein